MANRNPEQMSKLLRQNRLKKRATILVEQWVSRGVSVSPVVHDRYWLLLDKLRGGRSWPLHRTDDLPGELRTFGVNADVLTILGWDVDEEPALLISAETLMSKSSALDQIYPDGFVLVSDVAGKALLVDFDEVEGTHINIVDLRTPSV